MQYVRLYSDAAGETHFATVNVDMRLVDFSPPAPLLHLADFAPAERFTFGAIPAGWHGDWHPTPRPQMFFFLAGIWEVTASDGEVRRFTRGSVALAEDTTGKGHVTRIVGDEDALAAIVQLPA
jgi:hypothetical protein